MRKNSMCMLLSLLLLLLSMVAGECSSSDYEYVLQWGEEGPGDGQFRYPVDIAVDKNNHVYVLDFDNNCIQKFDSSGTFLTKWGAKVEGEEMSFLSCMSVDAEGNVYVGVKITDPEQSYRSYLRVQKLDSSGVFLTEWEIEGLDGSVPRGITIDSDGSIYISASWDDCIRKFDSSGKLLTKWGARGSADGHFIYPSGIVTDDIGNVYVLDTGNNRVQKFDSSGIFLTKWGTPGTNDGQFYSPSNGIAVDADGNVYVADSENHRVQKFESSGEFLTTWGSKGDGDGQLDECQGIAIDTVGSVYVVDTNNHRVQKFARAKTPPPDGGGGGCNTAAVPLAAILLVLPLVLLKKK